MLIFSFMKTRKPRQFDYRPRYYDPEAELREMRKKEVLGENYKDNYKTEEELQADRENYKPGQYLQGMSMRQGMIVDRRRERRARTRMIRSIIVLVLLILCAWWLWP